MLGAKVLLRGLVHESFKVTQERIKQVLFTADHPDESLLVGIGIDPVMYRTVGAGEVPALVFVKDEKFMVASGASSVAHLLTLLSKEQAGVTPWVEWFDHRHRGFLQGGPTEDSPPPLPAIDRSVKVRADARGTDIAERDLIDALGKRYAPEPVKAKARLGSVALGMDANQASLTAKFFARPLITGSCSGVNAKRLQEALRSVEEFGKPDDGSLDPKTADPELRNQVAEALDPSDAVAKLMGIDVGRAKSLRLRHDERRSRTRLRWPRKPGASRDERVLRSGR